MHSCFACVAMLKPLVAILQFTFGYFIILIITSYNGIFLACALGGNVIGFTICNVFIQELADRKVMKQMEEQQQEHRSLLKRQDVVFVNQQQNIQSLGSDW